jgi:plastocyanin
VLTVAVTASLAVTACSSEPTESDDSSESTDGATSQAEPDREIAFDAVDFQYENLDLGSIADGDTIRFVMQNGGEQRHEFEVIDPNGEPIGEVEATDAGESGNATMTFTAPGVYTYQCILVDPETDQPHTELGMTGTFDVAER